MQSNGKDKNHEDIIAISRLSYNSVSSYVELLLIEDAELAADDIETSDELTTQVNTHPLIQWEKETQHELFDFLKLAAENKRSCQLAKEMVLTEGLSNLGIEI